MDSKQGNMLKGSKHEEAAAVFDKLVFTKVQQNSKKLEFQKPIWFLSALYEINMFICVLCIGETGTRWQGSADSIWRCSPV